MGDTYFPEKNLRCVLQRYKGYPTGDCTNRFPSLNDNNPHLPVIST